MTTPPPDPGPPPPDVARRRPGSTPIADYAVLGDGRTAALVSREGSVDWLCLPHFDSPACFAALLGTPDHGRWLLTVQDATSVSRRYVDDSFVLETTYRTPTGTAVVVDAMPLADGRADLVRSIEVTSGSVVVEHEWVVRFGYGAIEPWVRRVQDPHGAPAIRAIAGPDALLLRGPRLPQAVDHRHHDEFEMSAGESMEIGLTWTPSWDPVPPRMPIGERLEGTRILWAQWAHAADYDGPYRDAVVRSLLVLRLLTDGRTGGIIAAPTTSLPEDFGGERNWDYRYCWLRDAALTLEALLEHGYRSEATDWRDWLLRAVAGDPRDLQIMYGTDGRRDLPEVLLDHLPGHSGSRPVRIGNAAVDQMQLDVLGEVMSALHMAREAGLEDTEESWSLQRMLVEDLTRTWRHADRGIWEVRGEPQHFTHSKIMAWAAVDRAVRAVEDFGLEGPVARWRAVRDEIREDVLAHGYDAARGTFVQFYGGEHTDASLLQMVQVGFLPPDYERFLGTLAAIRAELEVSEGLVHRYLPSRTDDGLVGGEHPFLACSFWLADALARCGDVEGSTRVLDRLVGLTNDLGLLSEEYDVDGDRMAGNFPQALSHLALVRAVHSHAVALDRQRRATAGAARRG
ncbi:glycoside hydrolase family 15 protein [Actinotalea ferrariae]|uniref:glycoside hydrolase family 15 protein n=1 Tax=Actinotalea ferrariae TaxID=1386098 RepID=UPI001C8BF3C3|nr:glycoside hydrolase family 15 protein [Actinotalea ferrariae]MBX9244075.1 glycoside hydrolase family 15 protein [Actinotalea ferrariae]